MEVSVQLHTLATLFVVKESTVHTELEAGGEGGGIASLDALENNALPLPGTEIQFIGFTACGLVTVLLMLSQFVVISVEPELI
jgi:hypothetical protein